MRFIKLETERLLFRKFNKTHFPIVYDWLGKDENMKYTKKTLSEEETHKYLEWEISNSNGEECINFEFGTIGVPYIIAKCNAKNIASYRIMDIN